MPTDPPPDLPELDDPVEPEEDESFARRLDEQDTLHRFRERFLIPRRWDGRPVLYLCGNSLGLQPIGVRAAVERELEDWARLAVAGHFKGASPWYSYHETLREPLARLVGAMPGEVVAMNSLTVNLHLMMVSFYRPTRERHKILIEDCAFPSDNYAVRSQLRYHGFDPAESLIVARPRRGESTLRDEDLEALLEERGAEIALVLLPGVQYYTGQIFDVARIAAAARRQGCAVGLDLAHAVGNVPLALHDWQVDFAVWCSYKYLNAGPGAVAGCFVHADHQDVELPRFAGWWGNDPETRFRMHLQEEFVPQPGADGWQLSNPPILAMAPLRSSLSLFEDAGIDALRAKSERMTGYLDRLLRRLPEGLVEVITPSDPAARGCQLSMRILRGSTREISGALEREGVVCDVREPDVLRAAPTPLYNTFQEVWRFAELLGRVLSGGAGG